MVKITEIGYSKKTKLYYIKTDKLNCATCGANIERLEHCYIYSLKTKSGTHNLIICEKCKLIGFKEGMATRTSFAETIFIGKNTDFPIDFIYADFRDLQTQPSQVHDSDIAMKSYNKDYNEEVIDNCKLAGKETFDGLKIGSDEIARQIEERGQKKITNVEELDNEFDMMRKAITCKELERREREIRLSQETAERKRLDSQQQQYNELKKRVGKEQATIWLRKKIEENLLLEEQKKRELEFTEGR